MLILVFTIVKFSLITFVNQFPRMIKNLNLEELFFAHKEDALSHRYITNNHIETLLKNLNSGFSVAIIGSSVNAKPIYGVKIGTGQKKVLMWSQMHGNESTTTKALFDIFNCFHADEFSAILKVCSFYFIPILNPDGAYAYARVNDNNIDLNRDAQDLSQPESKVLRQVFEKFKPDFCFNLHGQRTIFSAGKTNNSATLSFLAPAQDVECTITENRKKAMNIIGAINTKLQSYIPNQIGIYDDAFNINCVGDTFQSENVPTVLFEAGHYANDYAREEVRKYIFISMIVALNEIVYNEHLGKNYESYLKILENKKLFYDIIIRDAKIIVDQKESILDIAVQFDEVLNEGKVHFEPKIKNFGDLSQYYGHKVISANKEATQLADNVRLEVGNSIDFVMIKNKLFSLNSINN